MIVRARSIAEWRQGGADLRRLAALAAAPIFSGILAIPAAAQVSGSIDVESDYRLRGYSLSAGRPAATAQIGYDDASGIYLTLSATGIFDRNDDPLFLGVQGNIGYVRRLSSRLSIDGGILRSQYRAPDRDSRPWYYSEVYLGLADGPVTARVYYSPDYYGPAGSALYGEIEATIAPAGKWRLNGHLGSRVLLSTPTRYRSDGRARYDWRVGISRPFGSLDLHATASGGGPDKDYYAGKAHGGIALTAGASWSF